MNYKYEDVVVNFNEDEAEDITEEMKLEFAVKYRDSIKKVLK